jgi:hypothetical protein
MNNNECCIADILEVINVLQCQAEKIDDIPNTCDRPFLGSISSNGSFVFNTRPITLYNSNNTLITMPYTLNGNNGTSSVFRVEKVNGCCATCRVLAPNPDTESVFDYVATDNFFTINCKCTCALACLPDTFIDCF